MQALRKYLKILRISLVERLTYRADFFVTTFFRFLPLITTFLLWKAIYAGSGASEIATFSENQMIAYLLLVQISRMFSSMPGLANGIARDIRDGNLKKYLLQPIDMLWYLLSYRGAHKMAYIATTAAPYALLFLLFHDVFTHLPGPLTCLAYFVSLLLAFLIGFFFEACMGIAGFWLLDVTSVVYIVNIFTYFVSGQMFPLELLQEEYPVLAYGLKLLPFQYLAYFPAMVFLEKLSDQELAIGLLVELGWAVGLILLCRRFYGLGLRHYSAFGG
ncbi:MAG TPA: ABC-2 family transporter protein [Gemmataceae bacterium]|nr:ABC-2 family transporter protein [Gemmataceae bacterium]